MKKLTLSFCIFATFLFCNEKNANAQTDSIIFNYVGDTIQTWRVPCGVDSIQVKLWGGGGGSGYQPGYSGSSSWCGGSGAYITGMLYGSSLTGQLLTLYVPHGGQFSSAVAGGAAGWPGGGAGGADATFNEYGGGGAGYAGIAIGGTYYVVAGGGGAGGSAGYGGTAYGGGGGATTGGNGVSNHGTPGYGGTISAGGAGGSGYSVGGLAGSFLTGGTGEPQVYDGDYGGGGGGAGYYGGGGGGDAGNSGGGGSSYPGSTITVSGITFALDTNIQGTMNAATSGSAVAPGPHAAGIGNGNYSAAGGNGEIIIYTYYHYVRTTATMLSGDVCRTDTNGSAYATASGGSTPYAYSWSNGETTDTAVGLSGGTYTVNVTDSTGCIATASVNITAPPVLVIDTAHQIGQITCNGDSNGKAVTVVSGGTLPYTYSWMPSGGSSDTATGLKMGTYTLTVTDPCNDTAITTVTITQPATFIVGASQTGNILCYGGKGATAVALAIGGTGAYTYMWNTGATTATATDLYAITYSVRAEDVEGCKDSTTITITQPAVLALISVTTSDTGDCNGTAWLNVSGGTAPYNYLWSDGNTTDTLIGECAGTYCCTVIDAHGCSNYECATVASTLGINNISKATAIKVYPNPTNGQITVSGLKQGEVIELYNYMGQKLSSALAGNSSTMQFNIADKTSGIYLLKIEDSQGKLVAEKQVMKMQ